MKRIVAILLCLVLMGTLALSASAAGSAHMSLSSSASTVYRGETFTLTVSLSNDQAIGSGGLVLDYDSSTFEILAESECNVDNTVFEDVGNDKSSTFAVQPDAVISGTIFTLKIKVKDTAAFGTYYFGGTARLECAGSAIDCGLSGTNVTVGCQHSFGAASKVDDANHQSTCSVCSETVKAAHTWDEGTVTKAATCKDTGSKVVKCTACGAEKTEAIPANSNHTYGSWSSDGIEGHNHTCSLCGAEESADHRWYTTEILEEATCQKTGSKKVMCEDCGASAEMDIGLADHTYNAPAEVTETQHTLVCAVCATSTTADHSFGDDMEHDKQMHYFSCEICGYKKDQAEHVPGPKATEETDQVCTVCDRILKPKGAHVHEFKTEWAFDELNHWHECVDCPATDIATAHIFDNTCDADCNDCGFARQTSHIASPVMESDATGHWNACLTCGEKLNFTAHTPGPEATISSAQTCTVCKFEIAPIVPHDHIYNSYGTVHFHKCVCGMEYEADAEGCGICAEAHKSFPWWIVCIVEAVIFAGVTVYLFLTKKRVVYIESTPEDLEADFSEDVSKLIDQIISEDTTPDKKDE